VVTVGVSPCAVGSAAAAIVAAWAVLTHAALADSGKENKDVPKTIKKTPNLAVLLLANNLVNLINP